MVYLRLPQGPEPAVSQYHYRTCFLKLNIGISLILGGEISENCQKMILIRILGVDFFSVGHGSEGDFGVGRAVFLPTEAVRDGSVEMRPG